MNINLDEIKCYDVAGNEIVFQDKDFLLSNTLHIEGSVRVCDIGKQLYENKSAEVTPIQLEEIIYLFTNSARVVEILRRATLEYLKNLQNL